MARGFLDFLNYSNNAVTTLDGAISDSSTTITVDNGDALEVSTNFRITIWSAAFDNPTDDPDREIIEIESRTGDVLTVVASGRGLENTLPQPHLDGDRVMIAITADGMHELQQAIADKEYIRLSELGSDRAAESNKLMIYGKTDGKLYFRNESGTIYDLTGSSFVQKAGDTMTGALTVDGTANVVQLLVQGHSTQTANILEVQNSAGVKLVSIEPSGHIVLNNDTTNTPSLKFTPSGANPAFYFYMRNSGLVVSTSGTNVGRLLDFFNFVDGLGNSSGQFRFYGNASAMYPLSPSGSNNHTLGLAANKWNNVYSYRAEIDLPNIPAPLTPSSDTDTAIRGDIKWDSSYLYLAIATNSWKRIPLSTFASTVGVPGGSTGQIQYNNAGAFAGDADLNWDSANDTLEIKKALFKPIGTSAGETGEIRLAELAANGSNYAGFKAPDSLSANIIYKLPSTAPTDGQVLEALAPVSGVSNLGWITPSGTAGLTPYAETPSGTINGSNTAFTLAHAPANNGGVIITLNGLTQRNGVDYTVSGVNITFATAPATSSEIFAYYNTAAAMGTVVTDQDIEVTDSTKGLVLKSPDNTRWRVTIDNAGSLVRTSL